MSDEQRDIEALVRQVVQRTLGQGAGRPLLDEETVRRMPVGSTQLVGRDVIITPLARQVALERRIRLEVADSAAMDQPVSSPAVAQIAAGEKVVALGADHGGYSLKDAL